MDVFHVIIDTSVLRQAYLKSGRFDRLLRRVQQGVVKLYIPEVVLEEWRTQLLFQFNKFAEEARTALREMRRPPLSMLLEGLPVPSIDLPDREEVNLSSLAVIEKYLADKHVEVLRFSGDHAARAMARYMHGRPPFIPAEKREAERKHIPDSWILEAALEVKERPGRHCVLVNDGRFESALQDCGFQVFKAVESLDTEVESATAVVQIPVSGKASEIAQIELLSGAAPAAGGATTLSTLERLNYEVFRGLDVIVIGMNEALGNPEKGNLFETLENLGIDRVKAEHMARTLELAGALVDTGNHLLPTDASLAKQIAGYEEVRDLLLRMV